MDREPVAELCTGTKPSTSTEQSVQLNPCRVVEASVSKGEASSEAETSVKAEALLEADASVKVEAASEDKPSVKVEPWEAEAPSIAEASAEASTSLGADASPKTMVVPKAEPSSGACTSQGRCASPGAERRASLRKLETRCTCVIHSKRFLTHCPAYLRVSENSDGSVSYEGCIGHLGHVVSAATLRIPKPDQEDILRMLRGGMHAYEIMAKIRRERWDDTKGPNRQARICYVQPKDIWRLAHRHGLVQRRYRTAKRMAAAEAGESSDQKGPKEEVLPSDDFDYHVQEVIDLTDDSDETPQAAPVFWQTMQRVDTAAIEAFRTFQEISDIDYNP
ncbi:hypothetical protein TELCIR_08735 [Teladorsagia circumcincta]|uniref:Uncharacterized protein n=1 Tax=Teladorsagia circumcincta TaxID=45464 RepID=A0A2G9UH16_TELCI|nr:hypothetical protein TELCIR_08735 [Teladorsagia circumcincta]